MPQEAWKFFQRRTKEQRAKDRKRILLWDAAITKKTQERYYLGVRKLLPSLSDIKSTRILDEKISDWIQQQWEDGECLHAVSDALCGLHHYEPWTKNKIPLSWRLFKVWRKVEAPNRAPPLVSKVVIAWILYAIAHRNLRFAAMLVLGFYGLLRTGEFLQIRACDLLINQHTGIISLKDTKTGLRNAAQETVSVTDPLALDVLRAIVEQQYSLNLHKVPIWDRSAQSFRNEFAHHAKIFDLTALNFRPYSLRRGGATHIFQMTGSMEVALLKGRWGSTKVAKIYLSDGLSYLPGLTYTAKAKALLSMWSLDKQLAPARDRKRG